MNTPNPVPPVTDDGSASALKGWQPTGSTIGSGVGGALSIVLIAIIDRMVATPLDAMTISAITTLCSTATGYFLDGGRK